MFQDPSKRTTELRTYVDASKVGPRTAARLQQLVEQAAVAPPPETIPPTKESTSRAAFKAYDLTGMKIGARVMQSQDYVPIPAEQCDFTFRAESGMSKKANIDALRAATVDGMARLKETAGGDIYKDTPETLYTQKVQQGSYPDDTIFGSKPNGPGSNPFAKNTEYSKLITDYTKDPAYVE